MSAHVRGYLSVLRQLLEHRATRGYRSMRFFRYVGKQKTVEKVCDMIAPRDKIVVVGFGNWSNSGCGISRRCSGPVKEIRQRLSNARRSNVMFKNVDEFKSSCTCNTCCLTNIKASSRRGRKWRVGLQYCRTAVEGGRNERQGSQGTALSQQCLWCYVDCSTAVLQ